LTKAVEKKSVEDIGWILGYTRVVAKLSEKYEDENHSGVKDHYTKVIENKEDAKII